MIQASDVLGKDYKEFEKYIVRRDFGAEALKSFSKQGIHPPLTEAIFNVELYFNSFKIERYKVRFFKNKIFSIQFIADKYDSVNMIQNLINQDSFIFKFYTNKQLKETEWIDKGADFKGGFTEWKIKKFDFDGSSVFNIESLGDYGLITFYSQQMSIMVKSHVMDEGAFYLFELQADIHIFKNDFQNN